VTFGLAPIVLSVANRPLNVIGFACLALYGLAALIRLIRTGRDYQRQRIGYLGLPMPAAGGLIVGFSLVLPSSALPFGIALVAFLAVTQRLYPSHQSLWRQDPWISVIVAATGAILAISSWETAWLTVSGAYAGYPWIKSLRSRWRIQTSLDTDQGAPKTLSSLFDNER
jgi:phosphatidylserine synthase